MTVLFDGGPRMPVAAAPQVYQVMHLGDMDDPKWGTVSELTQAEYELFIEANTWPHPHSKPVDEAYRDW